MKDNLSCTKCKSSIENISQATIRQQTGNMFCPDCVVDTHCRRCGENLCLTVDQFSGVDGEPICVSCDQQR